MEVSGSIEQQGEGIQLGGGSQHGAVSHQGVNRKEHTVSTEAEGSQQGAWSP
jgi:hypothetical protein